MWTILSDSPLRPASTSCPGKTSSQILRMFFSRPRGSRNSDPFVLLYSIHLYFINSVNSASRAVFRLRPKYSVILVPSFPRLINPPFFPPVLAFLQPWSSIFMTTFRLIEFDSTFYHSDLSLLSQISLSSPKTFLIRFLHGQAPNPVLMGF
jgi:hypothetical protein